MVEEQKSINNKLELGYFRLTHELLKSMKINEITFGFFRFIETLQIIHFVFRSQTFGEWNSTVFKYSQLAINYISVDYLIQNNPSMFIQINIGILVLMFLILLTMALFIWKLKKQQKTASILKSIFPLINFSLYLFKTIFQIPILNIIYLSLMANYKASIGIDVEELGVLLGVLNLILFIIIQLYLISSFKDCNPFSDLIHAGESSTKSIAMLLYKAIFTLYLCLDNSGQFSKFFLIAFLVINAFWAMYYHFQIGYYKQKVRTICLKLHYGILCFSFISLIKIIRPSDEMSILFYLCASYIMCYRLCDFIEKELSLITLEKQMMFIKNVSDLEAHVIHLIRNIDTFQKRQSRIILEGYLAYHHRQCKLPETNCICHQLKEVKERTAEQKSQFFAFVIDILKQNLNRFSDTDKIHVLLSCIYQYRQKNRFQAIYSLKRTLKSGSFMNHLYYYHQINLIESQMIEDDSKDLTNKAVDINKFFDYNNLIVSFQEMLEECSRHHILFWNELLEPNTDIKKLEKSGTLVTKSKETVRDEFQKMTSLNPNNVHTLTVYGKFLIDVVNEEASNIKYLEKAQSILKNLKQSSKIQDNSSKYTDNAETTIVVIDGSEIKLGIIVHTNNYVKKMLGYKRSQCIGINVNCIMPKIFGESHNQVLAKYLSTSSNKYNGKQRIVPSLSKQGYMIPVVALTKALPNLQNGIQIVGFISKLQQRAEQEQIIRKYFYLLYRSDNEQVVGISQNCYSQFHIPCCLIYGNPYNNNNQLKIRNLFGFSFEKDKEGQVSTALQTSEVVLTLNSTKLNEEFIITKNGTNQQIKDDLLHLDSSDFGVQVKIVAKCLLSYNYNGIPLKMLSIYKYGEDFFESKNENSNSSNLKATESNRYFQKAQNDDFKDLKDFKNFISIKSEPSAISIINNICCILMFVIASCIITFIVIWISLKGQNQLVLDGTNRSLRNEIIMPNLLFEMEKYYINRHPQLTNTQFNESEVAAKIKKMVLYIKTNERLFLPIKYSFMEKYAKTVKYYTYDTLGTLIVKDIFIDEAVTMYISLFEALIDSTLDNFYTNPVRYDSNPFLMYLAVKNNEIFSLRQGSLQSLEEVIDAYYNEVNLHKIIFYVLSAVMLFGVILWFFTSIPYVLSVTKINNRVLSLFSLIPNHDVLRLIGRCYLYMKENLTEAIANDEDLNQMLHDGPVDNQIESFIGPTSTGVNSPAAFLSSKGKNIDSSPVSSKKNYNCFLNQNGSPMSIEEKFSKMVNSQNQQKNKTVLQFLFVSLLLIGYFLFNHFYAFGHVTSIELSIQNLKNLGRRISILTNVKLLLTEYIIDENYQFDPNLPSIKDLNNKIIDQSYAIERILLKANIGSQAALLQNFNSGNICSLIQDYQQSSIFPNTFSEAECTNLKQGILVKGLKTSIVTMLEEVRTILSLQGFPNRKKLLQQKMFQYEAMIKYLENPMLKVIDGTESEVNQGNSSYELVLIICSSIFLVIVLAFWKFIWTLYIEELNNKIWRTKGMLNIIPMRIITANELLKNQFASGQLEKAVR